MISRRRPVAAIVLTGVATLWGAGVLAQAPAPPQPPPAAPPQAPAAGQAPPAADVYTYDPVGRRDPFLSLLTRGADLRGPFNRPEGLEGQSINDISVRGILRGRAAFVALLQGPDNRTFIVRTNDKLFDGSVKSITEDAVIFSQDVNDPLSLVKQREVRKSLRAIQEGK